MKSAFDQVTEFHRTYGQSAPTTATLLSPEDQKLRAWLLDEERAEYEEAVVKGDIVEIADALVDMLYIVLGTAVSHGITRLPEMFAEVHRSNMSKLAADGSVIRREDGKILKGPNYFKPNLEQFL